MSYEKAAKIIAAIGTSVLIIFAIYFFSDIYIKLQPPKIEWRRMSP